MLADVLIVFGARNTIGPRQPFQVAQVELAKVIKAYGLRLATSVAAHEMERESATVVDREALATVEALG